MPVQVQHNANTMRLTITPPPNLAPNLVVNLDMSLQRHAYEWLDGAQAKPQNSILYHSVTAAHIQQDLQMLGTLIERKMAVGPSLQAQLAATQQARNTGATIQAATLGAKRAFDLTTLAGDYHVTSGRIYRVDNVAMNPLQPPNHCYPILGPNLWSNVSQQAFAAAAALSWLQKEMANVRDSIKTKWDSMQHMPAQIQNGNSLYRAMSGARTHYRLLPGSLHNDLALVSGQDNLIKGLASI